MMLSDKEDHACAYDPCQTEADATPSPSLVGGRRRKPQSPLRWARGGGGAIGAVLIALALLLLAAVVVIAVLAHNFAEAKRALSMAEPSTKGRCTSEACVRLSARMLASMNRSANPCDNFYQFACGAWQSRHTVPHNHRHSWSAFDELQFDVDNFLRAHLEMRDAPQASIGFTNAKTLYEMCMNTEKREAQSLDSLRAKVAELGGAPMTGHWQQRNLTDIAVDLLLLNVPALVKIQARANEQNSSIFILSISPPEIKVAVGVELNQTIPVWLSHYLTLLYNVSSEQLEAIAGYIRSFTMLATAYSTLSEWSADDEWHSQIFTIAALQAENQTHIDWLHLFRRLVGAKVTEEYEVHVKSLEYLQRLNDFLSERNERAIVDGMITQFLLGYMDYMPSSIRLFQALLIREAQGDKFFEPAPSWHDCLDAVKASYPLVLAKVYLTHYFSYREEIRADVSEMISKIKSTFEQGIIELDWMDSDTKSRALHKLKVMEDYIAYDALTLNDTYVEAKSSTIMVDSRRSYLSTIFNLTVEKTLESLEKIHSHSEDMHETMATPFVVNAFYDMRNSFYIMAAILQGAFYGYNNPSYINYGAMGFVIGHEITHGFDDDGRKYDSEGNLLSWWQPAAEEIFAQKKQCFVEQYGSMKAAAEGFSYQVDGNLTLSENMADNGGLKSAYRAYELWQRDHGDERLLPEALGIDTWQQAFFVASAQLWCAKYSASGLADVIERDNHAPGETRVNAVLMNFDKFAEAFHCHPSSPMNPPSRCAVW